MDGSIKKAGGVFASLLNRRDGGTGAEPPAHREPEIPEGWPRKLPFRKRPKPFSRAIPWAPIPERPALQINPAARDRTRPYELFVAQAVLHDVRQHLITASTDEPFGFLLGQVVYCPWTETPYVLVDAVRRETQNLPPSDEVDRFRHAWIGATRDARHRREQLIGWYHRHGVLGMRMSEWDLKLQDEFFPEPWQVALIVAASSSGPIGGFIQRSHRARLFRKGLAPFQELVDLDAKLVEGLKASVVDWTNYQSGYPVHVIEAKWPSRRKNTQRWSEASHAADGVVPLRNPEGDVEILEFPTPKSDGPRTSSRAPFDPEGAESVHTPVQPGGAAPSPEDPEVDQTSPEEWMAMLAAEALASRRAEQNEATEAEKAAAEAAQEAAIRAAEEAGAKAAEAAAEETARQVAEEEAARKAEETAERDAAKEKAEAARAERAARSAKQKAKRSASKKAAAAARAEKEAAAQAEKEAVAQAEKKAAAQAENQAAEEAAAQEAAAPGAGTGRRAAAAADGRIEPVPVGELDMGPRDGYDDGIPVFLVKEERWRPTKNVVRLAAGVVILLGAGIGMRALTSRETPIDDLPSPTARPPTVFQQPPEEFRRLERAFRLSVQDYRARYVAFQQDRATCEALATDLDAVTRDFGQLEAYSAGRPAISASFSTLDASYRAALTRFRSTTCQPLVPAPETPTEVGADGVVAPGIGLAPPGFSETVPAEPPR